MRLIGYVRVSRVGGREGPSFISPAVQRARIEQLASSQGHVVVGWEEDRDKPGRASRGKRLKRPGFDRAIAAVERGEADGVGVAKLTRFARSVSGAAKALERLEAAGGVLVASDLNMDTSTPSGKLMRNVLFALAEFELDVIAENWEAATSTALARGAYLATTPTGYRRRGDGGLEPDPPAAAVIHEVFVRRARGETWASLARFMTEAGVPTPFGNERWTGQSVKRLVSNVAYLGTVRAGDRVERGKHDPIVTRAEFEGAQRPKPAAKPKTGDGLLLVGLARCGSCRYRMKGRKTGSYACSGDHAAGVCPHPTSIRAAGLDEFVLSSLWESVVTTPTLETANASDKLDAMATAVDEAERELDSYLATELVDVVGPEAFRRGVNARQRALDETRARLADAQNGTEGKLVGLPLELREAWGTMDLAERRRILVGAIDAVVVWPASGRGKRDSLETRVRIVWRGEAPRELPGPGRVVYELKPWPGARPTSHAEAHLGVAGA